MKRFLTFMFLFIVVMVNANDFNDKTFNITKDNLLQLDPSLVEYMPNRLISKDDMTNNFYGIKGIVDYIYENNNLKKLVIIVEKSTFSNEIETLIKKNLKENFKMEIYNYFPLSR